MAWVDSQLEMLEEALEIIKAALKIAEKKNSLDEAVKIWLDQLLQLDYEFEFELQKHQPSASETQTRGSPIAFLNCFYPNTVKSNTDVNSNIETSIVEIVQNRLASSSVETGHVVYGRNEEKAIISRLVLSEYPSYLGFNVISIAGIAGIGKTALARNIYNDKAVEIKFDIKAWVSISYKSDGLSIQRAILESITFSPCNLETLDEVHVQLQKAVEGKKLLLVLDNVSNESYMLWENLTAPFKASAPYSKIIVTTRDEHIALSASTTNPHYLKFVSNEDCWSIFKMHAFGGHDINEHQISELFRKKVIQKCKGLPQAASILGDLLHL